MILSLLTKWKDTWIICNLCLFQAVKVAELIYQAGIFKASTVTAAELTLKWHKHKDKHALFSTLSLLNYPRRTNPFSEIHLLWNSFESRDTSANPWEERSQYLLLKDITFIISLEKVAGFPSKCNANVCAFPSTIVHIAHRDNQQVEKFLYLCQLSHFFERKSFHEIFHVFLCLRSCFFTL